jgi:hypothetical protein
MGEMLDINRLDLGQPTLRPGGGRPEAWQLELFHGPPIFVSLNGLDPVERARTEAHFAALQSVPFKRRSAVLTGREAEHALALLLPRLNLLGGGRQRVGDAVAAIEAAGGSSHYFAAALAAGQRLGLSERPVGSLPATVRLALEMAANEETERRALEGELTLLERAWHEAEEVAGIADDLLLPDWIARRIRPTTTRSSPW